MTKEGFLKFYLEFRLYIFPIVVAVSSLILIFVVIYPTTVRLINNQKLQKQMLSQSAFLETKAATLEKLDQSDLSKKVSYALVSYPTEPDYSNILGLLQQIANKNGFSVTTLSISNSNNVIGGVQKYNVKLEAIGGKDLLPRLITSIESSTRIMKVKDIAVSPGKDINSITLSMEVEVLYSAIPTSLGGPDSPLPQLSDKDQQLLTTLAIFSNSATRVVAATQSASPSSPRGKANPFE